jgi:hypothetical protein
MSLEVNRLCVAFSIPAFGSFLIVVFQLIVL